MGSGDAKPALAPGRRYLNVCFVAGFLLVFVTYVGISQQFAITSPNAADVPASVVHRKQEAGTPGEAGLSQEDRGDEKTETTKPAGTSGDTNQDQQQRPEQEWRPEEDPAVLTEKPPKRDDTAGAKPFGMSDACLP